MERYDGVMSLAVFFSNPWVVGIGGGILSGLAVAFLTRYTFSEKDNKEYAQKIASANMEVIYALRSLISEPSFPAREIITSLINATARKYSVEPSDMYDFEEFIDNLVKEVMDSNFIPSKTKLDYCNQLNDLKQPPRTGIGGPVGRMFLINQQSQSKNLRKEYRQKMLNALSLTLGLMVTLSTFALTFLNSSLFSPSLFSPEKSNFTALLFPLVMGIAAALLGPLLIMVRNIKDRFEDSHEDSEDEQAKDE